MWGITYRPQQTSPAPPPRSFIMFSWEFWSKESVQRDRIQERVTYGLLSDDTLGGGSIGAGGLLVLDRGSGAVPGGSRLLLGGEPGRDVAEHFELFKDRLKRTKDVKVRRGR